MATDHAPHDADEKEVPFEEAPFGVTGLETAFAACHTHLVRRASSTWPCWWRAWARTPAAALGLPAPILADGADGRPGLDRPRGAVHVGDAGFRSKSRNSAFLGDELYGRVLLTIAGGRVAWRV